MGVVIGRLDGQVARVFLGENLTKSTKNYDKMLESDDISEEEKERILRIRKKKQDDEIIL